MKKATPNAGHRALARLVEQGKMAAVVTQNIDGLHQASGVPDDKVVELHGNATYATCLECRRRYELDWVRDIFAVDERLPLCTACGGMIKTATISFGQSMPEAEMQRAQRGDAGRGPFHRARQLAGGLSGCRLSAAGQAQRITPRHRQSRADRPGRVADLVINAEIGATMSRAVGVN